MNKTNSRSTRTASRKTPARTKASKSARRPNTLISKTTKAKMSAAPAKAKTTARRLVSRVKRTVSNAMGSRKSA